jgi:HNH endonuclease
MGVLHHTARWRKIARHQLEIEPLCRMCAAEGKVTPARIADHVEPHHDDPLKFWRGAIQSVCPNCHESRKKFQENRGYDRTIGADGWPTDLRHPVYNKARR